MSDDLIKRSDAIKAVSKVDDYGDGIGFEVRSHCLVELELVPSADRPQGEWMKTSDDWIDGTCGARYYPIHCSVCNYSTYDDSATNYCPNCGADMREGEGE